MSDWRPSASQRAREARAQLLRRLRDHFDREHVLEVETPQLSRAATTDPNIDSAAVTCGPVEGYLHTSPEFAMKRLIADGCGDCYQIARVFRAGESGRRHNPEFSLLEWYRLGFSLADIGRDVVSVLSIALDRELDCDHWSYREACDQLGGFDAFDVDVMALKTRLTQAGVPLPVGLDTVQADPWIDYAFSALVAPRFAVDRVTLVSGYPATQASLAAIDSSGAVPVALRTEAYMGELEVANGFEELRDADEQHARFTAERDARQSAGQAAPPLDDNLIAALAHGLPPCAGMAVGLDRLLMVLLGESHIEAVLNFPWGRA